MHRAPLLALLLPLLAAAAMTPVITFQNEAGVAPEEMASIERDFRGWAARVYAYHEATPAPVTVGAMSSERVCRSACVSL